MFKEVFYLMQGDQSKLIYLFFGYVIVALLDVVGLGLVIPIVSVFFGDGIIPFLNIDILQFGYSTATLFLSIGGILLLVFLLRAFAAIWVNYKILSFSKVLDVSLRIKLLESYQSLPIKDFNNRNSSGYIFTVNSRVTELTNGVLPKGLRVVSDIVVLTLISSFLFLVEPKIVILTTTVLFVFSYIYVVFFRPYLESASNTYQINGELMNKVLQDGVRGIKEVKVYDAGEYFINQLKKSSSKLGKALVMEELISLSPRLFLEFILVFLVLIIAYMLLLGNSNIEHTISVLTIFGIASMRLMPIASSLIGAFSTFRFSRRSVRIIYDELKNLHSYKKNVDLEHLNFDSIEFKNVSFSYEKEEPFLKHINFKINAGDIIGIYGKSGSGKSTLVDLIMGLHTHTGSTILINDQPVKNNILNLFAYIPQQVSITNDSIKNNVAFGIDELNISKDRMDSAINAAQLRGYIDRLPEGENTLIGENGAKISGGQRQRIAIARAFYHNRQVLIMDESTSALDFETEKEIIKEVSKFKASKTIIIISHNKETLSHCDYILNIVNGEVIVTDALI